jgi:hypothetical protein
VLLTVAPQAAAASAAGIQFAPHRAVYEMQLDERDAARNIAAVRGRMVFDIKGSHCAGYTLSNRMVTRITDAEGGEVVSDIRSETWEDGAGAHFRFDSSQYLDNRLTESLKGEAERQADGKAIAVKLNPPQASEMNIPGDARFPTQFSLEILEAARNGKRIVQAKVYDGSENGEQVFATTTFIGKAIAPGSEAEQAPDPIGETLSGLRSWPVSISYFDVDSASDTTPSYQLSFRLFENGVSRQLRIDYGTFALTGKLSSLELHEPVPCPRPPG